MKTYHKVLLTLASLFIGINAFAQTKDDAKDLVKQGVALNDSGKYDQAVAKYNLAIKADPNYGNAYYEMGYTLFISGKEKEAIPFLEKLIGIEPTAAGAYDMLGSIYDDIKQPDKAMEYYKQGIKVNPNYQRLHFNLAIAYYRQGKYPESEQCAIEAIKLDPKHASSQRVYAMATNKQGKLGCSLLGWCSFLLMEPQSKRSPEAFAYVKAIINHGLKQTDKGSNITYDPNTGIGNLMMPMAIINATSGKKNLKAIDSVQLQLTSLFEIAHTISADSAQVFVSKYYSDYFEKLGKSGNMPAFTRYITLSVYKDDDLQWFKEHEKESNDFSKWAATTDRKFE